VIEAPAIDGRKARTVNNTRLTLIRPLLNGDGKVEQWMCMTTDGTRVPVRVEDLEIEERIQRT